MKNKIFTNVDYAEYQNITENNGIYRRNFVYTRSQRRTLSNAYNVNSSRFLYGSLRLRAQRLSVFKQENNKFIYCERNISYSYVNSFKTNAAKPYGIQRNRWPLKGSYTFRTGPPVKNWNFVKKKAKLKSAIRRTNKCTNDTNSLCKRTTEYLIRGKFHTRRRKTRRPTRRRKPSTYQRRMYRRVRIPMIQFLNKTVVGNETYTNVTKLLELFHAGKLPFLKRVRVPHVDQDLIDVLQSRYYKLHRAIKMVRRSRHEAQLSVDAAFKATIELRKSYERIERKSFLARCVNSAFNIFGNFIKRLKPND